MRHFNLSDWALHHRSLVWYVVLVSLVAGAFSYMSLGREEDPSFVIKTMVITGTLPGATAEETVTQVTERIEKKLQELNTIDVTRSVTYPGKAIVYLDLREDTPAAIVPDVWKNVRNMMADIAPEFPAEFAGFGFNDTFGDVYGNIYAFTGDGFSPRDMKDILEDIKLDVLKLKDTGKVDLIGTQDQFVYVEFSAQRLAALGLSQAQVRQTLAQQNAIVPSGIIESGNERIFVRVSGQFMSPEELADTTLRVGDTFFTLSDVATVTAGYKDPPQSLYRHNGKPALGLIIGMRAGGNIVHFGEQLAELMQDVEQRLPVGITMYKVADQPVVVEESVNHFVKSLIEAVVIVLAVSFVSLGVRAGLVVTMTIPLVLAMTFIVMDIMGITLQRISLGALIIALGLLVDDAMIAIETMISRLELGESLDKAASYAWTSIAFPMLSGTLVTVAGFIPISMNASNAGEYTISLFYVIAASLILSWIVAVLIAPLLGVTFLPKKMAHHAEKAGRLQGYFHKILRWSMRARWWVIGTTFAIFALAIWGMRFVESQFFPTSDRPEIIVDVTLRQNGGFAGTEEVMAKFDRWLAGQEEAVYWSTYTGRSAPRFVLSMDIPTPGPNMGQLVIMTPDLEARNRLRDKIVDFGKTLTGSDISPKYLELGPPVGKPVQYRISGPDPQKLRDFARDFAGIMAKDGMVQRMTFDWNEPARTVRVVLDQNKMRQLGLTQTDVVQPLQALFDGNRLTELRDGRTLIDVVARGEGDERKTVAALMNLQLPNPQGIPIPLLSFAALEWTGEQPVINQRDRVPTITIKADILGDHQAATVAKELGPDVAAFQEQLPSGYKIDIGGTVEKSAKSQAPIVAAVPLMLFVLLTLVMMQMQSFRLLFIVLAAAPLGLIGVVASLIMMDAPLGFVAILGVLALCGILIRNSIILVHEIQILRDSGHSAWNAVFEASDSRARPILLTAAAASLALIPIAREVFWGPMAVAMMGGIIVGTLVTLIFLPALYCAVFRVREEVTSS